MPYKLSANGRTVLVKRGKSWRVLKTHKAKAEARAHLAALRRNVRHGKR